MTLSRECQQPSNSTVIHQKLDVGGFVIRRSGNVVHDRDWRVLDTLVRGLLTLW
jgi:hypothetical protein